MGCDPGYHNVDGSTKFLFKPGDRVVFIPESLKGFNNCNNIVINNLGFSDADGVVYHIKSNCSNGVISDFNIADKFFKK